MDIIRQDKALRDYLATGEIPVAAKITMTTRIVGDKGDLISDIIAKLCALRMLAKDLHYRALGKTFYAIHKFSDVVWDAGNLVDELIEVYYLGERKTVPPRMSDLHEAAVGIVNEACSIADETGLLMASESVCNQIVMAVEAAKKENVRSGTGAVLDEISKRVMVVGGLFGRTNKGLFSTCDADAG